MESGLSGSTDNFGKFREEMDRLGRKLRAVEADTAEWRRRSEAGAEQVRKMNAVAAERERELAAANKKAEAMEKLNRALQAERSQLLAKKGEKSKTEE